MAYISFKPSSKFKLNNHTGTGSSQTVTGVGFSSAFTWLKAINIDNEDYTMWDTPRGVTKYISSNGSWAEATMANGLTAWNSDGYVLGGNNGTNKSSEVYLGMNWKGGTTSGITTNGSTTITPSAYSFDATSGFSVVKYTGNGTSGAKLAHGLGAAPEAIFYKKLEGTSDWGAYHLYTATDTSTSSGYKMKLNGTDARNDDNAFMADTAPDATNITLGSSSWVNGSGGTYVAYCWRSIKGHQKFGGYTGNGSATEGFFQPLGFEPALVIVKKTSGTAAWYMWNNLNAGYNPKNYALFPYHTSEENTTERCDLNANGFKFTHSDADHNAAGQDFIYYAWAKNPLVGSNKTTITAK